MRDRYEGVCYDGPHEGRSYAWDRPFFRVALYRPIQAHAFGPDDYAPISVPTRSYRWSEPLRKWVFDPCGS